MKKTALKLSDIVNHKITTWLITAHEAATLALHFFSELTGLTNNTKSPPLTDKEKCRLELDTTLAAMHCMRAINASLQTPLGWCVPAPGSHNVSPHTDARAEMMVTLE